MSVLVIIPAAGSGTRVGGDVPKQYRVVGDRTILQHVVDRFLSEELVTRVVIPVAADWLDRMQRELRGDRVQVVAGGATRQESVTCGLVAADEGDFDVVAVHDAVRPFFSIETFRATVAAARHAGAALPAIPVTDTIHGVRDGILATTLDRRDLFAAQTPQCFRLQLLREVLERATAEGIEGTDEAGLAARFGYEVRVVPGDEANFKITRAEDLDLALATWSAAAMPTPSEPRQ
jgi:2-C-methyl-D-erythritol 4-phosphate cytidylyltransferase